LQLQIDQVRFGTHGTVSKVLPRRGFLRGAIEAAIPTHHGGTLRRRQALDWLIDRTAPAGLPLQIAEISTFSSETAAGRGAPFDIF
jgi:hypothetical protein